MKNKQHMVAVSEDTHVGLKLLKKAENKKSIDKLISMLISYYMAG